MSAPREVSFQSVVEAYEAKTKRERRYLAQLADALQRHEAAENWATDEALRLACHAVLGDEDARRELDTNPSWQPQLTRRDFG